jgi:hypothetical protein
MNEFSLAARRHETAVLKDTESSAITDPPKAPDFRVLSELRRDELLAEVNYNPASSSANDLNSLNDDRLREEVRWRRANLLREPALMAVASLLSKVSPDSFESLSQGEISPAQLIEKANGFSSGQDGTKVLKLPDRVEDHERRLNNLEAVAG